MTQPVATAAQSIGSLADNHTRVCTTERAVSKGPVLEAGGGLMQQTGTMQPVLACKRLVTVPLMLPSKDE